MHLSHIAQNVRYGFLGKIDVAIIEAQSINDEGEIVLGTGVGAIPTYAKLADKIIIELNKHIPAGINGLHDVYEPIDPPYRKAIPVYKPSDRIGSPTLKVDKNKIVGVVETCYSDGVKEFTPSDETTMKIGENVTNFLIDEYKCGRIPKEFLPIQSGVGNVANAVMACLGKSEEIPSFEMYTEVVQDSVIELMKIGKCKFVSTCSLTLSDKCMEEVFSNIEYFKDKILLRPGEISNNPEVIRRLGLITMNTADRKSVV